MNAVLNRKLWALIHKHKINPDQKDGLVLDFTGGRTHHSKEMSDSEASMLINHLMNGQQDHLRKQLIAMSFSIGENVNFIKGWCEKYGIYGNKKKFNQYTIKELIGLREKFRKVVADREKAVTKI